MFHAPLACHPAPEDLAPAPSRCPIDQESAWRSPGGAAHGVVPVSRWTRRAGAPCAVAHPGNDAHHCIAMSLKCTSLTFTHASRVVVSGRVTAGVVQVTAPRVAVRATFDAPSDVLHLYASQAVLAECYQDLFGHAHAGDIVLGDPRLVQDGALERLGQALAVAQTQDGGAGRIFTDSVSLAIVSRLVARHFQQAAPRGRNMTALPAWRLRRATDYIEAHLSEAIGLADIADSAGLTRMHFAAQFRLATGLRPHEYLLRRRIERAQVLLGASGQTMLDVALGCGFRSQSHFTTVFKRFVGETPYNWKVKSGLERKAA